VTEILYYLAAFGLAYIIGHAKITYRLRARGVAMGAAGKLVVELLECPACLGFWIGLAAGYFNVVSFAATWVLALTTCAVNLIAARFAGLTD
jgi:hypothetical protein